MRYHTGGCVSDQLASRSPLELHGLQAGAALWYQAGCITIRQQRRPVCRTVSSESKRLDPASPVHQPHGHGEPAA